MTCAGIPKHTKNLPCEKENEMQLLGFAAIQKRSVKIAKDENGVHNGHVDKEGINPRTWEMAT